MKKLIAGALAGALFAVASLSPAHGRCVDDQKSPCAARFDEGTIEVRPTEGIWGTGGVAVVTLEGQTRGIWGTGGVAVPVIEVTLFESADN